MPNYYVTIEDGSGDYSTELRITAPDPESAMAEATRIARADTEHRLPWEARERDIIQVQWANAVDCREE